MAESLRYSAKDKALFADYILFYLPYILVEELSKGTKTWQELKPELLHL
jgi:hypothetical protein